MGPKSEIATAGAQQCGPTVVKMEGDDECWIQIILVLVFILSRYWFKSIIRSPPPRIFGPILFLF